MSRVIERLARESEKRSREHRTRWLSRGRGIPFTSNDYLGLSRHPSIRRALAEAVDRGISHGATGSRLLSGNHDEHRRAEERFAAFAGRESALLFGSGYLANLGVLSSLPSRRDLVVLDSLAHASLKEGARASLATRRSFRHNDPDDLRRALRDRGSFDAALVVVEGVYSMDGDAARLAEIDRVAAEHDAELIVDEAHATGLFGARRRGMHEVSELARPPLVTVHPCGKALGCSGALVAADAVVIDALVNTSRPFIFSTAPAPLHAATITAALDVLPETADRRDAVFAMSSRFTLALSGLWRWRILAPAGPIVAIVIGATDTTVRVAGMLQEAGFDVRAIRPPTVPDGSARLRITITCERTTDEIDALARAIIRTETALCGDARE